MKFLWTIILCFTLVHATSARNYNSYSNNRDKARLCFRGEAGLQNAIFISSGLSYLKNDMDRPASFAFATYVALEANLSFYNSQFNSPYYNPSSIFIGSKAGVEVSAGFILLGAEYKGHTNVSDTWNHIATPKAGLTWNGFISLIYGRNIPIDGENYFNIGKHTVSFSINI